MIEKLFFWSGAVVWLLIATILLSVFLQGLFYFWRREISPSIENISFALFGKGWRYRHLTYYKLWDGILNKPSTRRRLKRRHNHFSRFAWCRLIREARREDKINRQIE